MYLAKISLLHRSPPSLCRSLFYVDNHVGAVVTAFNYHTRALRHVREHVTTETAHYLQRHLVMDRLLQFAAVYYGAPAAVVDSNVCNVM